MQGRFHRYEGYSLQQVTFPVRVLRALGATTLIVSNACGGMHPLWDAGRPGAALAITSTCWATTRSSARTTTRLGPRFPDMSAPYDAALRATGPQGWRSSSGITLREGVYVAVTGPDLETRAEYRMLRAMGADVVGMSTVPEVIVAVHGGMRVLGISIMTDQCLPDALEPADVGDDHRDGRAGRAAADARC